MFNISLNRPTHGARLERWLGAEQVARISERMRPWYGPPIAIAGVPGNVWALPGGDFGGIIKAGQFINAVDFGVLRLKARLQRMGQRNRQQCNAGFASLSDLIAEATSGKRRDIYWQKSGGATTAISACASTWSVGAQPAAGAAGSAAPGGRAPDGTTTGAIYGLDNVSPDTRHLVFASLSSTVAGNGLMMYDRIFDVAKTMNSTGTESVTGVPTRYQSSTATDPDYAGGNFCFIECISALSAGAHNWTVCQYRNEAGTDNQTFPSVAGISACGVARLDMPLASWFMPLASGDTGVKDLAQMQCDAAIASGSINFVVGHPLAWMPCPVANTSCLLDGINTAFSLVRIFDGAALAFLNPSQSTTAFGSFTGAATFVHG